MRSLRRVRVILVAVLMAAITAQTTVAEAAANPVPVLSSISPSSAAAGAAQLTITVTGSKFVRTSVVYFNGVQRTTTYNSATKLKAIIPATAIVLAGSFNVYVKSPTPGGGTSVTKVFTVNNPVPVISSLSPVSTIVGSGAFAMTINGSGFTRSSVARLNSVSQNTTYVSASKVSVDIPASVSANPGSYAVSIFNPAPGGGTSNSKSFTVNPVASNPVPIITSISPANKIAGDAEFVMTVNGTGFLTSSVVQLAGSARTTTRVSATQLTAAIPASDLITAGTYGVTVSNPAPGGGTSNVSTLVVNPQGTPGVVNEFKISISSQDHADYGFTYPTTFVFSLPNGSQGLSAYRRYVSTESWVKIPEKIYGDIFSGIEAVRFDYPNNKAYASVPFWYTSDNIYLKIVNAAGDEVLADYLNVANYYDNRKVAVTITIDDVGGGGDWGGHDNTNFTNASILFAEQKVWWTPAFQTQCADALLPGAWDTYQAGVSRGYLEASAHSRTHDDPPYADNDSEIGGCKSDIINNLNLPYARDGQEYVWCWIEPDGLIDSVISQKLYQYKYLIPRKSIEVIPNGSTPWATWSNTDKHYDEIEASAYLDFNTEGYLRNVFDAIYAAGGMYHLWGHVGQHSWLPGDMAYNHIHYIANKPDVWYAGFGSMYMYHYTQKVAIVTKISSGVAQNSLTITSTVGGTTNPNGMVLVDNGTVVSVTAAPISGYKFDNWTGSLSSVVNPLSVTVSSNMTLKANFSQTSISPVILFENYKSWNDQDNLAGTAWKGQTFIPAMAHTITKVRVPLLLIGAAAGNINVSIRATDSNGLPTGSNLASGSIACSALGTSWSSPVWYDFNLGSGASLSANTKYAILISAPSLTSSNVYYWINNAGAYSKGEVVYSGNSGSSWQKYSGRDLMFEEYGY